MYMSSPIIVSHPTTGGVRKYLNSGCPTKETLNQGSTGYCWVLSVIILLVNLNLPINETIDKKLKKVWSDFQKEGGATYCPILLSDEKIRRFINPALLEKGGWTARLAGDLRAFQERQKEIKRGLREKAKDEADKGRTARHKAWRVYMANKAYTDEAEGTRERRGLALATGVHAGAAAALLYAILAASDYDIQYDTTIRAFNPVDLYRGSAHARTIEAVGTPWVSLGEKAPSVPTAFPQNHKVRMEAFIRDRIARWLRESFEARLVALYKRAGAAVDEKKRRTKKMNKLLNKFAGYEPYLFSELEKQYNVTRPYYVEKNRVLLLKILAPLKEGFIKSSVIRRWALSNRFIKGGLLHVVNEAAAGGAHAAGHMISFFTCWRDKEVYFCNTWGNPCKTIPGGGDDTQLALGAAGKWVVNSVYFLIYKAPNTPARDGGAPPLAPPPVPSLRGGSRRRRRRRRKRKKTRRGARRKKRMTKNRKNRKNRKTRKN